MLKIMWPVVTGDKMIPIAKHPEAKNVNMEMVQHNIHCRYQTKTVGEPSLPLYQLPVEVGDEFDARTAVVIYVEVHQRAKYDTGQRWDREGQKQKRERSDSNRTSFRMSVRGRQETAFFQVGGKRKKRNGDD
ncbi:hypothetical protein PABG_12107 [Paracoccidioides brasiliensis Pb03]|uniref:Uncharacterized protein n=1 Tax=Paracoccidioides brasiliensis TaxID=121759 RepID=A0A1D2JFJ7_PARBR|nr:hypothetical protein PABG_12107 [Paracoccidioides brasiliensis Pb03]ODH30587.1 hypothetical protein ACO22_03554 [Paracoccidioides brasiliensis]ODH51794.1 hypothetical protein GX48_02038 [Paracoccidioides brasiliensis]